MISVFWSYKICSEVIRGKRGREKGGKAGGGGDEDDETLLVVVVISSISSCRVVEARLVVAVIFKEKERALIRARMFEAPLSA